MTQPLRPIFLTQADIGTSFLNQFYFQLTHLGPVYDPQRICAGSVRSDLYPHALLPEKKRLGDVPQWLTGDEI